jgi:hypothetical protein
MDVADPESGIAAISCSFCFGSSVLYRLEGTHGLEPDGTLRRNSVCKLHVRLDAEPVFEGRFNARHGEITASMARQEVHQNIEVAMSEVRSFDVGSKDVEALDAEAAQRGFARAYFADQDFCRRRKPTTVGRR